MSTRSMLRLLAVFVPLVTLTAGEPPPMDPFGAPAPAHAPAPAPAPTPQPATATSPEGPAPSPVGPAPSPELEAAEHRAKVGEGVAITGFVFDGIGFIALALLAAPAAIAAEVAEDRTKTNREGFLSVSDSTLLARAERRRRFARYAAITGAGSLAGGLVFTGAGLGIWLPARREVKRLRAAPSATLQLAPSGLALRF